MAARSVAGVLSPSRAAAPGALARVDSLAVPRRVPAWLVRDVLVPFGITRLALTLVGLLGWRIGRPQLPEIAPSSHVWINLWSWWDGLWYLGIARDGYSYTPGAESSAAFAPGLPLLMRLGGLLEGLLVGRVDNDIYLITGLLVSNLALLVALGYLVALVRLDFDPATARRAVLYLLVYPATLFLSAVYPHSLFLALAIAAFYYARQGRWWLAGLLGGLAGLTRLQAGLLVVPLAYEYLVACRFDVRRVGANVLALGLLPAGLIAFAAYLYWLTGEPLAVLKAGSAWHRQLTPPWDVLRPYLTQPGTVTSTVDLAFTVLLFALVVLAWLRLRTSLALFVTVFFLVIISSGLLASSMRYGLELFPVFIALAVWGRKPLFHWAYLGIACATALQLMWRFGLGAFVA